MSQPWSSVAVGDGGGGGVGVGVRSRLGLRQEDLLPVSVELQPAKETLSQTFCKSFWDYTYHRSHLLAQALARKPSSGTCRLPNAEEDFQRSHLASVNILEKKIGRQKWKLALSLVCPLPVFDS